MKNKFSITDLPILVANLPVVRAFINLFDDAEAKPASKERALPMYKIYSAVQKRLDLEGAVDYEMGGYCSDVYVDPSGVFAIVNKNDGKMYKATVAVTENNDVEIGEWLEVVTDFRPVVSRTSPGIAIERQEDGRIRWYAWPACTAALNRSGEIDSRKLFDSFIDNIERTGEMPELDFFHLGPDLVIGRADNVFRDEYAYCATGYFYDSDVARAVADAIEAEPTYWGNSIQYYPSEAPEILVTADGSEIPVYNAGVNRFISVLPEETAASILTSISTQGVERMNKAQREALEKAGIGKAVIDELDKRSRTVNESLQGQITRQKDAAAKPGKPAPVSAVAAPAPVKRTELAAQAKTLLKDPEFRTVLREELAALMPAGDQPAGIEVAAAGEETDEEGEGEGAEESPNASFSVAERAILKQLGDITGRLDTLDEIVERMEESDEDAEEELRTILADMPSRTLNQKILRPRVSRNSREAQPENMASKASSTLDKIREARVI